ncbi:MAG TPA: DNA polymerase III subunit delta' [Rubricoccaceae bacterium]|jgi:DNA polymerase-3 subunit delta'
MLFSDVIGQDRAVGVLMHALASGRVAHAYLLYGPAGSGTRAAALAFGQALLCERRGTTGDRACGVCSACERAARLVHPDLHVYLPFPKTSPQATRDDRPPDYTERLERLAADPYAAADYRARAKLGDDAPSTKPVEHRRIPMGPDEGLERDMRYVPVEGRRTVGVLVDAERMRVEAANSVLKLLEEPGPSTVLILTAERLDAVLPTILSRCQQIRFEPLVPEAVEAALMARGVDGPRAAFVARMADGSFTRALDLVSSEALAEHRALALTFLRAAYSGRPERLAPVVDAAAGLGREAVRQWLGLVLAWIRDLVLARAAGPAGIAESGIVNVDQAAEISAFVAHLPDADLGAMAGLVEQAAAALAANASPALALAVLGHALADAMRGRGQGLLVTPLDVAG